MTNTVYASLSRQNALMRELHSLANNVANASTTGFRRDAFIFSEYVNELRGEPSLSQTRIGGRVIDPAQGEFVKTEGAFDVAIEGRGFFTVNTPQGLRLTRAGAFQLNEQGVLTTAQGFPVGGEGGGEIRIPIDAARVVVSGDGVISADDQVVGRFAIVDADPTVLEREGQTLFRSEAEPQPISAVVRQGFVEASNVDAVAEIARLIEVQRAFELGQQAVNEEFERIRRAIEAIGGQR
jgi:flagellar basal-body rod protein FlgF